MTSPDNSAIRPVVTIVYNTCVYVEKFRLPLIAALQEAGYDVVVIAPTDEATSRLAERGIAHRPITMSQYGMNPLAEMRSIREIRGILMELRPVASLHYTIKPNTFGSIAAHQAGVPVLNNIAGAGRVFSGGNLLIRTIVIALYRCGLRRSHTVFFQNGDDMKLFKKARLVRESQCIRIPGSGVDLTRFRPTPLPQRLVRFLFVGRLLNEKGALEFLKAAKTLLAETSDPASLRFDLIGEWEDDRAYISRVDLDRLTCPPQINYQGTVPPSRINGIMVNTSCVVLPSYYGEGVPRVLLEACASGRPIITTDNVGCRDVVEPGENGWMVTPRDTDSLVHAMRDCARAGTEELSRLGTKARQTAEARFDERIVLRTYLDRLASIR